MDHAKLAELADARERLANAKNRMQSFIDEVKARAVYTNEVLLAQLAQDKIDRLTEDIRQEAFEEHQVTGKKILDGVTIKSFTRHYCTDQDAARKWVLECAPAFLLIDWKGLQQEAKKLHGSTFALPFYRLEEEVSAQIASDLSAFLPEATREG